MAKTVTVNNTTQRIPEKNDTNWGEYTTDLLEAIVTQVTGLLGDADIAETSATINNGATANTSVLGLTFDTGSVRGAVIDYAVYRSAASGVKKETGTLHLTYDSTASVGEKWGMAQQTNDDSGITFNVSDAGQVQYTSDTIAGTGYTGKMIFRARGILS